MKKKFHWCKLSDTDVDSASNQIKVEGEKANKNIEVKVVDENNNEVKRYQDVRVDKHKVLIIMNFQWETVDYQRGIGEDNKVEYIFKRDDNCCKIEKKKAIIEVLKKDEFEKIWKKMHGRLLEDKFRTDIGVRKKITGAEDMEYIISDSGEHDYRVTIYCNDGTSKNRDFPREKVKIEAQYYQNFNLGATDSIKVKYQEIEKSSGFTKVQTTLFILALILMVCLILFWKKIWGWIKGESSQEKKVREQLDIF